MDKTQIKAEIVILEYWDKINYTSSSSEKKCVGKSKSSGGFIWSKIKKENIYE